MSLHNKTKYSLSVMQMICSFYARADEARNEHWRSLCEYSVLLELFISLVSHVFQMSFAPLVHLL